MGSRNGPQGICFVKKQLYPLRHLALLSHISICKPSIRWLWWLIFIINLTIWNNLGKQTMEIFLWEGKSHTKCRKHHSTGWNFRLMIFFFKKRRRPVEWQYSYPSVPWHHIHCDQPSRAPETRPPPPWGTTMSSQTLNQHTPSLGGLCQELSHSNEESNAFKHSLSSEVSPSVVPSAAKWW